MGFLDKLNQAMDAGRELARDLQDTVESTAGQAMRAATGQAGSSLASNADGLDVFAPLVASANDIGYAYVARSESVDAAGWTLHNNRLGLDLNANDEASGGVRTTVEALNQPIRGLADWEIAKSLLSDGESEDEVRVGSELVRFLTHPIEGGWQSSFLRRRLVVRVRLEGPTATEHLARDFAARVCWNHLDLTAAHQWCAEAGVDDTIDLQTEVFGGNHDRAAAATTEEHLDLLIPLATDLCGATIADETADRRIHDWDGFHPGADLLGFEPTARAVVRLAVWEGVVWRGAAGEFAVVAALVTDAAGAVARPDLFAALLDAPESVATKYEGNTVAVGLDPYGYPSAHVTIGNLAFVVVVSGPAGHLGGRELVGGLALAAVDAMPD